MLTDAALSELPSPPPDRAGWPWTPAGLEVPTLMANGRGWPRVTVVTPSYNQGRFLEETIRSVLLQGYPDLEYIVIDGGSSDESIEIIHSYERWLAYWVSESDRGQTHAINKGWKRSTGEILAYINADDVYLSGAIANAAEAFAAQRGIGMVYGNAMIVDEKGEELRVWEARPFDLSTMLAIGNIVPQSSVFYSSAALKNVGYLNEEWQLIMDYDLCIRIGMQYPSVCIPETLTRFRNHPQSKTRLRFEALADEVIRFVGTLKPESMSQSAWRALRRATIARVRYELALAYLRGGQGAETKAFRQLVQSILADPRFALRQPILSAHIMKGVVIGSLKTGAERSRNS
jgi:glycosyltransferase involved in cell wall biosynthesis